jgi:hypothetical protein
MANIPPEAPRPQPDVFDKIFGAFTKDQAENFTINENYPQTKEYLK